MNFIQRNEKMRGSRKKPRMTSGGRKSRDRIMPATAKFARFGESYVHVWAD
jgi:hypothetical protein